MEIHRFFRRKEIVSRETGVPLLDARVSRPIPTGSPGELERNTVRLPAVEVKNRVLWVNPAFNGKLLFKLPTEEELNAAGKEGREISTNLGVFLAPEKSEPGDSGEKTKERISSVEVGRGHKRSGLLGRMVFKDDEGRLYRDVDMKGVGYTEGSGLEFHAKTTGLKDDMNAWGILNLQDAYKDRDSTETFLKKGIRTHRVVAIISLREIVDEKGNKISIDEAKRRKILHEGQKPVLEIRAYGTKMRINNAGDGGAIEDAMHLVAQELGRDPKTFGEKEYFEWFAETLARQVARMHKNGWVHQYLTEHNITLDARITDLDSVTAMSGMDRVAKKSLRDSDLFDARMAISFFGYLLFQGIEHSEDLSATIASWTTYKKNFFGLAQNKFENIYTEEMKADR